MSTNEQYVVCRHCGKKVRKGKPHHCEKMRQKDVRSRVAVDDDDDFFVSYAIAVATDDWLLGYAAGGNIYAAILGDLMSDDETDAAEEDFPVMEDLDGANDQDYEPEPATEIETSDFDDTAGDVNDSY